MHIREGAANGIKLVVICKHIHVRINSISQIILEDIPDEGSKYKALWASPGHPLPLAHYTSYLDPAIAVCEVGAHQSQTSFLNTISFTFGKCKQMVK